MDLALSPSVVSAAVAGAAGGAAAGFVFSLVALYFRDRRRALLLLLMCTALGALLGPMASTIFGIIGIASYLQPGKQAPDKDRAKSDIPPKT